jgi:hypothetical protein
MRGPKVLCGARPASIAAAKALRTDRPRLSLWKISAALAKQGYVTPNGLAYGRRALEEHLAAGPK